ncbi:MFS transporter [Paenibacillus sp. GCM10012307]|uniref:MFS transporter n=1 Tax=Paenibacillus TaxID=44249 RepID=UPI002FCE6169
MERTRSVWQAPFQKNTETIVTVPRGGRSFDRKPGTLDKQAALLLAVHALFAVANALSGTFVPVYLWKASQSFMVIGWFTLCQHFISGLTFWLAGRWVKEHNKMNCLRVGVMLSGIFYLTVLMLGQAAKAYVIPLGILNGMASGFFWLAYNVVYFEITEPDNRDRFNGWAGLLVSGSGIVAPWISGVLITAFAGNRGYQIIFTISLFVFCLAAVISFFLRKRESSGTYDWSLPWRKLKDSSLPWRNVFFALMAQGLREGIFMFLVGLMVFIATSNERKLGDFTLWTSLVGLVAFWLIGRWIGRTWRKQAMLVGVIMLVVVIFPLLWKMNYITLLWFGIGTALFIPLYSIPMTSSVFDMIGQSEDNASQREEYVILRELGLVLGRMLSLMIYLLVMSWASSPQAMVWLLLGVGAAPLIGWWFMKDNLQRVS